MARFFLVDDDPAMLELLRALLENAGHEVDSVTTGLGAQEAIAAAGPDCVVVDIMMPGLDGLELCRRLRATPGFASCKIVVVSGKSYEFDRRRALQLGADAYFVKPVDPETFVLEVERVLVGEAALTFWGARGTLPVPGARSIRYGGNTSCVTVELPQKPLLIFDAGSGIRLLSDHLMGLGKRRISGKIFITHPHWDHINALPFFAPLYIPGNDFEILGSRHGDLSMRDLIGAQMDGVYFPVTMREFGAHVYFRDLREERLEVEGIAIDTMLLQHPGNCLGYRVRHGGRSICYVTDNELFPPEDPRHDAAYLERLTGFVRDADVLITDATYTDEEYPAKAGWGHSGVSAVADLAHRGGVRTLYLFHHDPSQGDEDIEAKLARARTRLAEQDSRTVCKASTEGERVLLRTEARPAS